MVATILALTILICTSKLSVGQARDRVKVSVYYETLCPDSIAFIKNQLTPTYNDIGEIMDIELVPYGKAAYEERDDGSVIFRCQHGSRECYGNTVQACAIKQLNNSIELILPFVHCMETQRFPDRAGQKCAEERNLTWSDLSSCASGNEGQRAHLEMGKKTESLSPKMYFVPWINVNDVHSNANQDGALDDLLKVVCEAYEGENFPSKCEQFRKPAQGQTTTANSVSGDGQSL
ncbi:Gamma-interferon-inducible lysosomal thiol reductase [Halotydeus destructor]|nr:Gamma-interferon-inducible lysosomal thiol reductase [Halotydeus destructor]